MSDYKFDQFICIDEPIRNGECLIRFWNADGTESGMCGNALRCIGDIILKETKKDKVVIETLRFKDLIKKHSITEIEKIIIDVEGFEYEILSDIDLAEIKINSIMFEYKHFDGYLKSGDKLQEIIQKFEKNNYKVSKIDKENIIAIKH